MSQQPFSAAALRGAVDLSQLARPAAAAGTPGTPTTAAPGASPTEVSDGLLVQATDHDFAHWVNSSLQVPAVLVLWAAQLPASGDYLQDLVAQARAREGRFRVIGVEIGANPGIMQALSPMLSQVFGQIEGLPVVVGLLQGQPLPFYVGAVPMDQVTPVLEKFLAEAVTAGVTGRANLTEEAAPAEETETDAPAEPEIPPHLLAAYEAIEGGDLDAAAQAYREAIKAQPADVEAKAGLAQVELMQRTQGLDAAAVRAQAAAAPTDIAVQQQAADLDLVGGHVDDAFARLIDTIKVTGGDERNEVRERLLSLFEIIGSGDPRVAAARRALTNALF